MTLSSFRKLCFSTFLIFNAFNTVASLTFFVIVYKLFNGDSDASGIWVSLFGCLGALGTTFIVIPIVTKMSKFYGKKKAFMISQSISIIGYVLLYFLFIPGNGIISKINELLTDLFDSVLGPLQDILGAIAIPLNIIGGAVNYVLELLGISCSGPDTTCSKYKQICTNGEEKEDGKMILFCFGTSHHKLTTGNGDHRQGFVRTRNRLDIVFLAPAY